MDLEQRHTDEISFFDQRGTETLSATRDYRMRELADHARLFSTIEHLEPVVAFWGALEGKRVLDLGCGNGWISMSLAASGAHAEGIDISPRLIEVATNFARENGLAAHVTFRTMPCERLTFEDEKFDCAIMHAALHHCDVRRTVAEVQRVLKPGGKAVFVEDYAYHPLMRLYRRLSPARHTRFEKPLTDADLALIRDIFSSVTTHHYGLLNLSFGMGNGLARRVATTLGLADDYLFHAFPGLMRYSKLVAIYAVK